jgi:hypothetical protein
MPAAQYFSFITVTTLLLATLSYILVEQPCRNRALFSRKQIVCISAAGACLVLLVAAFLIHTADHRPPVINPELKNISVIPDTMPNRSLSICKEEGEDTFLFDIEPTELSNYVTRRFYHHLQTYKTFSNESAIANRRILLIGDSFAFDFMNMMVETRSLLDYEIRCHYVQIYCQIYMGSEDRLQWITPEHRSLCIDQSDIRHALPMIRLANIIILAGRWFEWSARRLPNTIASLNLTKHQRILVLGSKNFGTMNLTSFINTTCQLRLQKFQEAEKDFATTNSIMKQTLNASIFVDIMNMTCVFENGTCPVFTAEAKLISYDGWHTTKHGARYVGDIIFKRFPLNQL